MGHVKSTLLNSNSEGQVELFELSELWYKHMLSEAKSPRQNENPVWLKQLFQIIWLWVNESRLQVNADQFRLKILVMIKRYANQWHDEYIHKHPHMIQLDTAL